MADDNPQADAPAKVETPAPTVEDAINAALEPVTKPTPAEPVVEDPADDHEDTDGDEGTDPNAPVDPADDSDGDGAAKTAKPDGSEGKVAPKLDADGKPVVEAKKEPVKAADPLNDPIPATVSERTRERITSLVNLVKEKDVKVTEYNEMLGIISSTGMNADEFTQLISYARMIHSDKAEDMNVAYQMLQAELRGLALKMGKAVPEVDFLADHPDLQEDVTLGHLTKARADELAVARTRAANATRTTQQSSEQQRQTAALETARTTATTELSALGKRLAKSDPDYARKFAILTPALKPVLARLHPTEWTATVEAAFKDTVLPAAQAAVVPAAAAAAKQQPMRPGAPAGEGQRQVGSPLEAMDAALAGLR